MTTPAQDVIQQQPVGLIRRLMAIIYDLLLLLAILILASIVALILNHGNAIGTNHPYHPYFVIYLVAISFFYYGWFWTHQGQTLGMRTWKMQLKNMNHGSITWTQALIRAVIAMLSVVVCGLGYLWSLIDKKKRTWHDIASHTQLIDLR